VLPGVLPVVPVPAVPEAPASAAATPSAPVPSLVEQADSDVAAARMLPSNTTGDFIFAS
jgi:cytochrome c5